MKDMCFSNSSHQLFALLVSLCQHHCLVGRSNFSTHAIFRLIDFSAVYKIKVNIFCKALYAMFFTLCFYDIVHAIIIVKG